MKNFICGTIGLLAIVSCGAKMRQVNGLTEKDLKKVISMEKGCPVEDIKILDKVRGAYHATYKIEACGKRMIYKQRPGLSGFEEVKD